jgi:hypothetical protein
MTSPNGSNWTKLNIDTAIYLNSVAYGNGLFVAVGLGGAIMTSKANNAGTVFPTDATMPPFGGILVQFENNRLSAVLSCGYYRGQLKVGLFTATGKRLYWAAARIQNATLTIPPLALKAGKYFISISDNNSHTLSASFILTR